MTEFDRNRDRSDSPRDEPVIRDNRRVDPITGAVRDPSAGSAGQAGQTGSAGQQSASSPFPGAGRHAALACLPAIERALAAPAQRQAA